MATLLIVDDASFMRGSLKYIVENAGHDVLGTAQSGEEAIELYRKLRPDIVTLDILMKGMDGIETLRALRAEDPNARVIMITAIGHEEKQTQARALGAVGYIRKPFKQQEIVAEIEQVLSQSPE